MKINWRHLILLVIVGLIGAIPFVSSSLGIGMAIIFSCLWLSFVYQKHHDSNLNFLFVITIIIHLAVVLVLEYTQFYPFGGGRDDLFYHETAITIANRIHDGEFSLQGLDLPQYYPVVLGIIYAAFGSTQLIAKSFGVIFAALSAALIYLICREMGASSKKSFWSGMVVNLYPSYLFYGSLLLKDTLIVPLALAGLLLSIKLLRRFKLWLFSLFIADLIALAFLRSYLGITLFLSFAASFFLFSRIKKINKIIYLLFISIAACLIPFIFGYGLFGSSLIAQLLNPDFIASFREANYSIGGSSTGIVINFSNPIAFIATYIPSFIYVLLGPLPWQIASLSQLPALAEIVIFYPIIYLALSNILRPGIIKKAAPLLFFGLGLVMAIALFSDNLGANTRLRIAAYLAFACLAPLGISRKIYDQD